MNPPAVRDATIAARVPVDLREDLERLVERDKRRGSDATLTTVIRRLLRQGADAELAPAVTYGLNAADYHTLRLNHAPGRARAGDPGTSRAAARDVAPRAGSQRRRALELIAAAGHHGMTTDEVIAELEAQAIRDGRRPPAVNGVARRVTDLLQAGAITGAVDQLDGVDPVTGSSLVPRTRPTRHGSRATVYIATAHGKTWLATTEEPTR